MGKRTVVGTAYGIQAGAWLSGSVKRGEAPTLQEVVGWFSVVPSGLPEEFFDENHISKKAVLELYSADPPTAWLRDRAKPSPPQTDMQLVTQRSSKLRDLLWRAWTQRRIGPQDPADLHPVFGLTSYRDIYTYHHAVDVMYRHIGSCQIEASKMARSLSKMDDFDPEELETAMAASKLDHNPSHARSPSDRKTGKSTSQEASVSTPASARRPKNAAG